MNMLNCNRMENWLATQPLYKVPYYGRNKLRMTVRKHCNLTS